MSNAIDPRVLQAAVDRIAIDSVASDFGNGESARYIPLQQAHALIQSMQKSPRKVSLKAANLQGTWAKQMAEAKPSGPTPPVTLAKPKRAWLPLLVGAGAGAGAGFAAGKLALVAVAAPALIGAGAAVGAVLGLVAGKALAKRRDASHIGAERGGRGDSVLRWYGHRNNRGDWRVAKLGQRIVFAIRVPVNGPNALGGSPSVWCLYDGSGRGVELGRFSTYEAAKQRAETLWAASRTRARAGGGGAMEAPPRGAGR